MNQQINEHDIVALLIDLPDDGLIAGDMGAVVLSHNQGEAFEVEFANPAEGSRYLVLTVKREHLLKLRHIAPRPPISE